MKKLIIISLLLIGAFANAQPVQNPMQDAENYFKQASVVTYNEDYSPKDYIGSLIYYKDKEKEVKILKITKPNDSSIVHTNIDDILYQRMHTKEEVASAKFLGIFNSKVSNTALLEVILLRDYSLEANSFLADPATFKRVVDLSRPLKDAGFTVEFVWKVNVNKLTSRLFKEGKMEAGLNYQAEATGKIYNKTEDFTKKTMLTVQTIDVGIYIKNIVSSIEKISKGTPVIADFSKLEGAKNYGYVERLVE